MYKDLRDAIHLAVVSRGYHIYGSPFWPLVFDMRTDELVVASITYHSKVPHSLGWRGNVMFICAGRKDGSDKVSVAYVKYSTYEQYMFDHE